MANRIAVVRKDDCNPEGCGGYLCMRVCPVNRKGEECIAKDSNNKVKIDEVLCIGCHICAHKCPFKAIDIINLPHELDQQPIHQYGKNGFHLYNLPIPIFGKVVGILGKNGIGKSTAIKVLAGVLKPNLGKDEEAKYEELIKYFKGTEAQLFFEKVRDNKIKISYKPQQVDLIPKTTKGKVRELLEKVDEKGKLMEVTSRLHIDRILDNNIETISGGELQRVAIAATVLKKANLYVFDEPTSYLDIKQRIEVSKFIRELADDETAVLVVEHDLIILDYMTDLIHLMYGKEGCYGVVSQPKTTRAGINLYLSGYLREENIRFRDHAIKFEKDVFHKKVSKETLTSWTEIKKKLDRFQLTASPGEIRRKDVVGILGENGIGKTSFVKILAEVIEPDKGEITQKVKVSYKPQYIDTTSKEMVMTILGEAVSKYKTDIMQPLNIEPLLTKPLNELSGGELQRVAIALCLSKDVDLYLLDEPSAYLDVEQRLITAKIIKELMDNRGKTAMIVDHDLMFLDYLSARLTVFEGEPSVKGNVAGVFEMAEGMNRFLEDLGITFRRDSESKRPRANKVGSVKDREQKAKGQYYYV